MAVVLPILCFSLIFAALRQRVGDSREAAVFAACYWGCILFVITETLSVWHLLTSVMLTGAWAAACVVPAALLLRARPIGPATGRPRESSGYPVALESGDVIAIGGITLLVLLLGVTALACPPNTWDVVDYHLSRVALWISNRGVQFFPTLDYAQTINSPWAEYAILHLYLMFGGDRLVNLVEWATMVGSILVSSLIARELGADRRGQVLAATASATLPGGVLEASGAMNTFVVAFWIAACVYAFMRFAKEGSWYALSGGAAACGLAILTKGTAYVLLPAMIGACWWMRSPVYRRRFVVGLPIFALIVLVLNGPHFYRTFELTGSPLGRGEGLLEGGQGLDLTTGRLSLGGTVANVVRNATLNVTVTQVIDDYAGQAAVRVMRLLGQEPNDPAFIWQSPPDLNGLVHGVGFHTNPPNRNEVLAGNPLHLLLVLVAIALTFASIRSSPSSRLVFALGLIGAFFLFSALVRWQIWGARYQLPLFILGSALIGAELPGYLGRIGTTALALVLILTALPYALSNDLRPLAFSSLSPSRLAREPFAGNIWSKSRANLYFADQHQDLEESYMAAAGAIRRNGCDAIGLDDSLEHYEYPLLAQLDLGRGKRRIRYVGVYNASARYALTEPSPCLVVCFACAHVPHKWSEYAKVGQRVSLYGDVAVFSREGDLLNTAIDAPIDFSQTALISTVAQMRRDLLALKQEASWPRYKLYSDLIRENSKPELAVNKRFFAIERPLYNGARVWELTGALRTKAITSGSTGIDAGPLLAGEEALGNFVSEESRAISNFVTYAGGSR